MSDLKYIAFSYEDFFDDVEHQPNEVVGAYLRFLRAYTKRRCEGLPLGDRELRMLSGCLSQEEWESVKPAIFGTDFEPGYFKCEEDKRYHQKRAREEFQRAIDLLTYKSNAGRAGARGRWGSKGPPPKRR